MHSEPPQLQAIRLLAAACHHLSSCPQPGNSRSAHAAVRELEGLLATEALPPECARQVEDMARRCRALASGIPSSAASPDLDKHRHVIEPKEKPCHASPGA